MARTWSVPHGGSFAGVVASGLRHHSPLKSLFGKGIRDAQRDPLLLTSALLTGIGIAALNVDSQSLATVLLVAGAGLAAAVILFCRSPEAETEITRREVVPGRVPSSNSQFPAQFTELLSRPRCNTALDRAVWAKLTAHMSHELRTPLNAVLGFSELMSNEVFGPLGSSCYSDYARDIHSSGRMLLKSAEDALAITALLTAPERKGSLQSCCLQSLCDDAQSFAQHDLGLRSITVVSEIDPKVKVIGDPQGIRQMLINLISATSRSARSGSVLEIDARAMSDAVTLSITVPDENPGERASEDGFPLMLARTLCELSNAQLSAQMPGDGSGRRWTVQFLAATQDDLFLECA
jgi:two-component system cell cycle sensor histidine kinase PleC